ncbi:MAG: hypothetical protein QXG68_00450, partial [Candidatus Bathyarchaeia archaeon]
INVAILQERVQLPRPRMGLTFGRRIREVCEVIDYGKYERIASWNPITDSFNSNFRKSEMLKRIALKYGVSVENVLEELSRRAIFFRDLLASGVRNNSEVKREIMRYYLLNPFPAITLKRAIGG